MARVECHPCVSPSSSSGLGFRLGVGVLVVGQSMIFGLALNLHEEVPAAVRWWTQSAILAGTLTVLALLGGPLLAAAIREARRGRLTIEALFVLTLAGALVASLQAHLTGQGPVYYEVVSILVVVYTFGRSISERSRDAAWAATRRWAEQFAHCRLLEENQPPRQVSAREVRPGQVVLVAPGEAIAVDGVIVHGQGYVNESAVNGEPFPVVKGPGQAVVAGAIACDAALHIRATSPGTHRRIDRLLEAVEAARSAPTSLQARTDAIGRVFLPIVLTVALATFLAWTLLKDWSAGLFNAMSVLLVACPCVIGLATPVILWTAIHRLAGRGLEVRSGDTIERLAQVDYALLDKTGTLTADRQEVERLEVWDDRASEWLAALAEHSQHPTLRAFARSNSPSVSVRDFRVIPGQGVTGWIDGQEVHVGRPEWIANLTRNPRPRMPDEEPARVNRLEMAIDGCLAARATLVERVRATTPEALADLNALGLPIEVVTGDRFVREGIAPGVRTRCGLFPEDKAARVAELTAQGHRPLMVGDGINDASALAQAHVGIALASGTDLAIGAADAILHHGDLRAIPWAIQQSRLAVRALNRNLLRALAYNVIGLSLAAWGWLHPIVAALLMVISSLSLVVSATRLSAGASDAPTGGELFKAGVHALAFTAQALVLMEMFRLPMLAAGAFALLGLVAAFLWLRTARLSHTLDMIFGMLTVGNLGMVLGWWADLGFAPARCLHCCSHLGQAPFMWLGMLALGNLAMFALGRTPSSRRHQWAMASGGNAGMLLGMIAGGMFSSEWSFESLPAQGLWHLAGMTAGMILGMLLGTWLVEHLGGLLTLKRTHSRGTAPPEIQLAEPPEAVGS